MAETTCTICFCPPDNAVRTVCDHTFCKQCIECYIENYENKYCPVCRNDLSKKDGSVDATNRFRIGECFMYYCTSSKITTTSSSTSMCIKFGELTRPRMFGKGTRIRAFTFSKAQNCFLIDVVVGHSTTTTTLQVELDMLESITINYAAASIGLRFLHHKLAQAFADELCSDVQVFSERRGKDHLQVTIAEESALHQFAKYFVGCKKLGLFEKISFYRLK